MKRACLLVAIAFLTATIGAVLLLRAHLPEGVERRFAEFNGRKVAFDMVNLSAEHYTFQNVSDPANPKTVKSWREALSADIVFNSAYFKEENAPTGYYAPAKTPSVIPWPSAKEQADPASYSFLVRIVEGRLALSYLPDSPRADAPTDAFLSFPTFIADSQDLVTADSGNLASRTMLAQTPNGDIYLIVTERAPLSLFEAAQWLSAQPEHFVLAGNLDGGPSTGLSITDGKHVLDEPSAEVPNVLVGTR